jgi:hypothetical protein
MGNLTLSGGIGESEPSILENIDFNTLEKPIRFSFRDCSISKDFCIRPLTNAEIQRFYSTLSKFEEITWKQARQMPREKGFSPEKKDSENHKILKKYCELFSNFIHFRVNGTDKPFRVFATQDRDLCRILLLDRDGKINHS